MEPQFWRERWARNEIGFHQPQVNALLTEFWPPFSAGIVQTGSVLVPLCGKTLDMVWLHDQGHSIVGIELSVDALRDFFSEQALSFASRKSAGFECLDSDGYRLLAGNFFDLTAQQIGPVKAVYDRAALIALPEAMQADYARHLLQILPQRPPVFLITLEYDQAEMSGPPFAVSEQRVRALFGGAYVVDVLSARDVLDDNTAFQKRGLTQLVEKVYWLR
jgi:thiopurine S-methyltransferase